MKSDLTKAHEVGDRDAKKVVRRGRGISSRAEAWASIAAGDMLVTADDREDRLKAYRAAFAFFERRAEAEAGNTIWQRDLAASHERIGDVLRGQGDREAALREYRKSFALREKVAEANPDSDTSQLNLSMCHDKIGDVLHAQGDHKGALDEYRKSLSIRTKIAKVRAAAVFQYNVSVSSDKIGDVLHAQGDHEGALREYHKSFALYEKVAGANPKNSTAQHNLSVCHDRIGDVLLVQGDHEGALDEYRKSFGIRTKIAKTDPDSAAWQRNLLISHDKIGNVLFAQGDREGALREYRKSVGIGKKLAAADPDNSLWQNDLVEVSTKIPAIDSKHSSDFYQDNTAIDFDSSTRDVTDIMDKAARFRAVALDHGLSEAQLSEAIENWKRANGETTGREITARANEASRPVSPVNVPVGAVEDSTLGRLRLKYQQRLESTSLPEDGYRTIEEAKAAGRLVSTYRNLRKLQTELGAEPEPENEFVTAVERARAAFYRSGKHRAQSRINILCA